MRPRTCCCAAIAEVLRTDLAWPSVLCRRSLDSLGDPRDHPALFKRRFLVFQCHAFKVAAFKGPARRFCGRLVEASKACAVERLIAFLDAFSERIFGSERDVDLDLRGAQVLLRLVLVVEGTNLNEPSAVGVGCRGGIRSWSRHYGAEFGGSRLDLRWLHLNRRRFSQFCRYALGEHS